MKGQKYVLNDVDPENKIKKYSDSQKMSIFSKKVASKHSSKVVLEGKS